MDVSQIALIEKAILAADRCAPNDGKVIRISVPPLNEERRKELVKLAKKYAEERKVSIRNLRRDANETAKKLEKEKGISQDDLKKLHGEIQDLTDRQTSKVDELLKKKESEIMEV